MFRKKAIKKNLAKSNDFRWRSTDVTRLEGFSDAVFAFALTLLVVSLEVPRTFDDLLVTIRGFVAFAISFAFLIGIWYSHYAYFRRYGIIDRFTTVLNTVLLFLVLFFVYPLKFLFSWLINAMLGISQIVVQNGIETPVISNAQIPTLMVIYSCGYIAVFLIFALLYFHAYQARAALKLTQVEAYQTRQSLYFKLIHISFGLLSVAIILFLPLKFTAMSGWIYAGIGPASAIYGYRSGTKLQQLRVKSKGPRQA